MIKLGNEEVKNRYITDGNGIPHEVVAVYVGNNLVYSAKIEEAKAKFYRRKTGGTQSVGSGIAAIKEIRGKSIVWNQLLMYSHNAAFDIDNTNGSSVSYGQLGDIRLNISKVTKGHKYYMSVMPKFAEGSDIYNNYYVIGAGYINFPTGKRIITQNTQGGGDGSFRVQGLPIGKHIYGTMTCMFIDITLMFGAGNEPDTVAEFEKIFPLDYYDYNAGKVIPFAGQNLVTTGKNQYNPATGKANLLGSQTYQIGGTYTGATIDEVAVTLDSNNCFTTTKDCVLEITGGNDTDTFIGLYNGETNTYEPYEKHTLPLDPSQWRDKQGNLVFPYGGMHGVGGVYDYVKVDADGYIRKVVRRFGRVYLKNLSWTKIGVDPNRPYGEFWASITDIKPSVAKTVSVFRAICNVYRTYETISGFTDPAAIDKLCYMATNGAHAGGKIYITDSSYTSVAAFVAHFKDNDCLVYQLETPVEVELATPVYAKYLVDKDGTEEITPANGATPYTTMANLHLVYPKR